MKALNNILVISADEAFLERLPSILAKSDYHVCSCYGDACELLEGGFIPELFLVDLSLPEKTGAETLDLLQKKLQPINIPGIITTGNDRLVLYSQSRAPALLGLISKSGDESSIYERIKKLWDDYQVLIVDGEVVKEMELI